MKCNKCEIRVNASFSIRPILFFFISLQMRTGAETTQNAINLARTIYFIIILFDVRCADGISNIVKVRTLYFAAKYPEQMLGIDSKSA